MKGYEMNQGEYDALLEAAATPGVFTGGMLTGYSPAKHALEKVWSGMAARLAFKEGTMIPSKTGGPMVFMAEPQSFTDERTTEGK